jgi:hypothetical protein
MASRFIEGGELSPTRVGSGGGGGGEGGGEGGGGEGGGDEGGGDEGGGDEGGGDEGGGDEGGGDEGGGVKGSGCSFDLPSAFSSASASSSTSASSASSASPRLSVAISRRKWCSRLFWSANWAPAVVRGGGSGIDPSRYPSAGVPITSSDSVTQARQCCPLRWPTTLPSALSVSVHWFAFSHRKAW